MTASSYLPRSLGTPKFTQSEDEFGAAHISGVEETNRHLQILLSELLQKNHELRLEVAQLHGGD
jgi:hypothetical protein